MDSFDSFILLRNNCEDSSYYRQDLPPQAEDLPMTDRDTEWPAGKEAGLGESSKPSKRKHAWRRLHVAQVVPQSSSMPTNTFASTVLTHFL